MKDKGYFIDFVKDAAKNNKLGKELIETLKKTNDKEKLSKWFGSKGYLVSISDCEKLLKNKKGIINIKDIAVKITY